MKKPAKTVGELEYMIRVELERTCTLPADTAVHVKPHRDTWKAIVMEQGPHDAYLTEIIDSICDQLRTEYDLADR